MQKLQMFLTAPSIARGITAFTKQATTRALHTSQFAMAPIKVKLCTTPNMV